MTMHNGSRFGSLRQVAFLLVLALSGCASTPQASRERDAQAKTFETYPNAATVYIYRSPLNTAGGNNVLYIDNRVIGETLPGTYFRVNLLPGKHTLHGTGHDQGQLTLDVRPEKLYFVQLESVSGNSLFRPVPEAQGRKTVSTCCALLETWAPGQRPLLR
jgi:hypothetical protein